VDYISDLTCATDRRTLLTTSGEGTLTVYNVRKKKITNTIRING